MGYDLFTKTPNNTLTDFVIMIDLANCSSDFKSNWITNENGRGRAYNGNGAELPTDWVNMDYSSGTGRVYIRYTGTFSSVLSNKIKLYPPTTQNLKYERTDPYGQNNVWQDAIAVYLLDGDTTERSGKGYDLTNSGAVSETPDPGYDFDTDGDYIYEAGSQVPPSAYQSGFCILFHMYTRSSGHTGYGRIIENEYNDGFFAYLNATGSIMTFRIDGDDINTATNYWAIDTWLRGAIAVESDGDTTIYKNGTSNSSASIKAPSYITTTEPLYLGYSPAASRTFDGILSRFIIMNISVVDADWISEDNDQLEDNSTYWGTPTWIESGDAIIAKSSFAISNNLGMF